MPVAWQYCDPGLISEVVVPLLSMQSSVLLCISTILDSGNHYTKMMEVFYRTTHNVTCGESHSRRARNGRRW